MLREYSRILGIAGGTGSGKTTLARAIHASLGPTRASLIYTDSYYRPLTHLTMEERAQHNFDHPDAIEFELLVRQLSELQQGRSIQVPIYNFSIHDREPQTEPVSPTPLIIIEGILALQQNQLRPFYAYSLFVDTPAEIRYQRRLERDVQERGRTPQSVLAQWKATVEPMHDQYCEPSRRHASRIIDGRSDFASAIPEILSSLGIG